MNLPQRKHSQFSLQRPTGFYCLGKLPLFTMRKHIYTSMLFEVCLATLSVNQALCRVRISINVIKLIKFKECAGKRSWPDLRFYPGICLEGSRKTTKNLRQESLYSSDIRTGHLRVQIALPLDPTCSLC